MNNNWLDDSWSDDSWSMDDESTPYRQYDTVQDLSGEINNGQRLRDLRLLADISSKELSDYAMIEVKDLLAIEAGMMQLDKAVAYLLAKRLGVQITAIWAENVDKAA